MTAGTEGVVARIRNLKADLTAAEASVAEFVLERPQDAIRLSIDTMARRIGVSSTTIMRFCQALGFKGIKDLKIALASETGGLTRVLPEEIRPGDGPGEILHKVIQADIEALSQTLSLIDVGQVEEAVRVLDEAGRIEIYGVGSSVPVATDAYYRFLRIGMPVSVVTDSHMQVVSAAQLSPGDVALVVSHTGRTRATLTSARIAREAGARVIGLTSFLKAPLRELCDVVLVTATAETAYRLEAMSSRIAHLSVIDALYVALAARRPDTALVALERTGAVIEAKRESG